jgi:hypothetical protein
MTVRVQLQKKEKISWEKKGSEPTEWEEILMWVLRKWFMWVFNGFTLRRTEIHWGALAKIVMKLRVS